ncbi:MAG: diaminopimelate decarboxylase [Deltaproteobacteria bacterium]|nr:diaminopimelate decarboxylase [Deltaproteobacteria bacterium]
MDHFHYRGEELFCDGVSLARIAESVGTPCYVYSHATLVRHYRVFADALSEMPHLICYSVKANTNGAILAALGALGAGADIVSAGELVRALRAGIPADRIVFSGVGKQAFELERALEAGILMFNVESEGELELLAQVADRMGKRAPISLRVNPDVDPGTHPYIATGLRKSKFGVPLGRARAVYERALALPSVEVRGIDCHIGSQLTSVSPFVDSLGSLVRLAEELKQKGVALRYLDVGGGLGIRYSEETPPSPEQYGRALAEVVGELKGLGVTLICEPGRVIVGNAGVLLTRVIGEKHNEQKRFAIIDGAMNDLIRPALYGSFHSIRPVRRRAGAENVVVDVVGPICESGDFLAQDRPLPAVEVGDLLSVMSAGAYGYVMSSNYNSRPRAAEVMVKGEEFAVVRERESLEDLTRGEHVPAWVRDPA